MGRTEVEAVLDVIVEDALSRPKPALGRIATVKSMVDLGVGLHSYRDVQKQLQKYLVTGGIYSFDLARRYPAVFVSEGNSVGIASQEWSAVKRLIGQRFEKVRAKASAKSTD